jgi:hypothetical protein
VRYAGSVGQSTMFGWDETERQKEASWSEFTGLYRAFLKKVTVSEIDREERPVCYTCVPSNASVEKSILDFVPITFLSCFFVQTGKGNASHQGGTFSLMLSFSMSCYLCCEATISLYLTYNYRRLLLCIYINDAFSSFVVCSLFNDFLSVTQTI